VQFSKKEERGVSPHFLALPERSTGEHNDMEKWTAIRLEMLKGALSKRTEIAMCRIGWRTLTKMRAALQVSKRAGRSVSSDTHATLSAQEFIL
jgi:hypothetical protein